MAWQDPPLLLTSSPLSGSPSDQTLLGAEDKGTQVMQPVQASFSGLRAEWGEVKGGSGVTEAFMNKGDFDKCNVCFTADYQASLSDEMPLHYFL